jgi:acetyl coenzyme A synthetase (ADP forming)-like protein
MPATAAVERPDLADVGVPVRDLLNPRSIAVIGASRQRESIGGRLFRNLLAADFSGPVYPVNAHGGAVQGVRAYASILDVPDDVDLALIAVPAEYVIDAARQCAAKGVRGLVVVSAGFAEVGERGARLQDELQAVCRAAGMRLIGPNCMGIANTAPDVRLNGQFAPITPLPGRLGVIAQSGALGLALIHEAGRLGLGLSSFVSVGNQADVATDDLLAYWADDPATEVILLYLESIADPRRFARIARRVARAKPIVVVKSGRSGAGARATSSHTGALLGASDVTVDALFRQAGVIRTDTLAEMFDVAALLASQPIPTSNRVAILTNGGGPGILAADACDAAGLELPPLATDIRRQLAELLPGAASVGNPVDMIASATPADYARAMALIGSDPNIDSLIVISGPPLATPSSVLAGAIREAAAALPRPLTVAAVFMSTEAPRAALSADKLTIPAYLYPENAAYALGHAVRYGQSRAAAAGRIPEFPDVCPDEAAVAVAAIAPGAEGRWLDPTEVRELLRCYGLPLIEEAIVTTPAEAAKAAERFGGPCALKGVSTAVVHKSEAGGVRLDLATPADVESAARQMAADYASAGYALDGFMVQPMAAQGVELLVGVVHDRLFGPVVACAIGGTQTELLKDVSVRITPLTDTDAAQMVRALATFPLLDGYRGAERLDVAALEDVLLRVSAMVEALPQIAEMDLNPVIVLPRGAIIVDARIRVESALS